MITHAEVITMMCTMSYEVLGLPLAEVFQDEPGQIRTEETETALPLDTHGTIQLLQTGNFGHSGNKFKRNENGSITESVVNDNETQFSFNIMGKDASDMAERLRACFDSLFIKDKYFPLIGFNNMTAVRDLTGANDHRNVPRKQFQVTFNVRQDVEIFTTPAAGGGEVTQVYIETKESGVTRTTTHTRKP